jgi:hypothetical protein
VTFQTPIPFYLKKKPTKIVYLKRLDRLKTYKHTGIQTSADGHNHHNGMRTLSSSITYHQLYDISDKNKQTLISLYYKNFK